MPFRFAQLSDPHLSDLSAVRAGDLASKRVLGYLSWRRRRRHEHRAEMLDRLREDLHSVRPDHTVVTGDLTHIALASEFREARAWLESIGPDSEVTVIPGNHDAYVPMPWDDSIGQWSSYMRSDTPADSADPGTMFPTLRVRGPVAFIGLNTATPTPPFFATGCVGAAQLERLRRLLDTLHGEPLLRVLLLHHPPVPGEEKWRKRLTDARALCELLHDHPVDLVLHGHRHRALQSAIRIPDSPIPVFGIPSASAAGVISNYPSEYNLYEVSRDAAGWIVEARARRYAGDARGFESRDLARLRIADSR